MRNFHLIANTKGVAMPIMIILIAMMLLLGITIVTVVDYDTGTVTQLSGSEEALHIAEAGYNRYLWLLNDDTFFYKNGENANQGFVIESTYTAADNPEWDGYTKNYQKTEYKSGSKLLGYFQISITPPTTAKPVVGVRSTGWTADGTHQRTIYVEIHKREFHNYVELNDDMPGSIGWGDGEIINGPYFTNGVLRIVGNATFKSSVGYVKRIEGENKATYLGGKPVKKTPLQFPSINTEIKSWADKDNGGYYFTGRTCIYIMGNQLRIRSKNTQNDKLYTMNLPSSGVIYVDGLVFIAGVLDGRLTVVAENNIYITSKDPTNFNFNNADEPIVGGKRGGLLYADQNLPDSPTDSYTCDDMLGLITNKDIYIATSSWPDNSYSGYTTRKCAVNNIHIQAAMLGLGSNSKYGVENLDDSSLGDRGYVYFCGSKSTRSVAATFRQSGNKIIGYRENNSFDYRMAYDAPPHYLEPMNSGWEVVSWKEE